MISLFNKNSKLQSGILTFPPTAGKKQSKYALIIYVLWALRAWKEKVYTDESFIAHSMHWESIEMMRILTGLGYQVDTIDCTATLPEIEWSKYELVIDERNN